MIPKVLSQDKRIQEVETQESSGSDYKYFVFLKEGFRFRGYNSRTKGFNKAEDVSSLIETVKGKS